MTPDWYEVVAGSTLTQGDRLPGLPVFRVVASPEHAENLDVDELELDAIIISQSCDLEHDKVQDVLVAHVLSYQELVDSERARNQSVASTKFREAAISGSLPPYFLLPPNAGVPSTLWALADFHRIYTVPKPLVLQHAASIGPRLRLRSPYREHLAQAFARYMMRVGLPEPLDNFKTYSPS